MKRLDFEDWYIKNFDDNAVAFAEKHEDIFEAYCQEIYAQLGSDNSDDLYDEYKLRKFEEESK